MSQIHRQAMQYVDSAVARFAYTKAGSGPPVLLVPGAGGWLVTFRSMMAVLAESHTVFALDPPGQGRTEVKNPAFRYDTDAVADSIALFLDAVGISRTAIVGHSWGGGFALRLAQRHPERVSRMALLAPGGIEVTDSWEFRLVRTPVVGEIVLLLLGKRSARHMLRKSFAHRERIPEELVDEAMHMVKFSTNPIAQFKAMLRVERSVNWTETERDLHCIQAPVLLLWGGADRIFSVDLIERFTSQLPCVQAHVLDGCGHSLHDDCPEQTYPLLVPFLDCEA
jgi:pimeloyl-ACP methyl ester carboxylesterase